VSITTNMTTNERMNEGRRILLQSALMALPTSSLLCPVWLSFISFLEKSLTIVTWHDDSLFTSDNTTLYRAI